MATCPECDAEIEVDHDEIEELQVGDAWECDECGSRLRVATLSPLEFDVDDDDDEDEEADEEEESDEAEDDEFGDDDEDESEDWDE